MNCSPISFVRYLGMIGAINPCRIELLARQTPRFFDLAKLRQHPFILLINSIPFRHPEKLDHVSMRAVKYDKRRRTVRPPTVLAEVTQFFGFWVFSTHVL